MSLITIYLGNRAPKLYKVGGDPARPELEDEQPQGVKNCTKARIPSNVSVASLMPDILITWKLNSHDPKPAWISGTDDAAVADIARLMGISEVRPCEPAEGDD